MGPTAVAILGIAVLGLCVATAGWARQRAATRRLAREAAALERGERLRESDDHPAADLARAINGCLESRERHMRELERQRNELEALLGSMTEGVIAVDGEQRVLRINDAAASVLALEREQAVGRTVPELARSTALIGLLERALSEEKPTGDEIVYHADEPSDGPAKRWIQAEGTSLTDHGGRRIGALVVLHDVTRLRRLEAIRRDFVANVSHELRTPVTTIKGFVETLREDPAADPEQTRRFLEIIGRQAHRLEALIADLFTLAQIERSERIEKQVTPLGPLIDAAIETCHAKIADRDVIVEAACAPSLQAPVNESLFEQAVVNLVDNAVKYSHEGGRVTVEAASTGAEIAVAVHDQGPGIEEKDRERVFERFYRADPARSRALGGTGLGLAIVKHVAHAHGGRVSVTSRVGHGSTFRVHIPATTDSPDAGAAETAPAQSADSRGAG